MTNKKQDVKEYSGKLILRLPIELHAKLAQAAQENGTSLNQYLVYLLAERNAKQRVRKISAVDESLKAIPKLTRQADLREGLLKTMAATRDGEITPKDAKMILSAAKRRRKELQ